MFNPDRCPTSEDEWECPLLRLRCWWFSFSSSEEEPDLLWVDRFWVRWWRELRAATAAAADVALAVRKASAERGERLTSREKVFETKTFCLTIVNGVVVSIQLWRRQRRRGWRHRSLTLRNHRLKRGTPQGCAWRGGWWHFLWRGSVTIM